MRTLLFTIATALTFSGTPYAFASEVRPGPEEWINTTHVVRLLNGNELRGDLIDRNDRTVTLELDSLGTYAIPVESVDQVLAEDGKIALPPRVPEFTMDVGITRALPVQGVKLPDEAAIAAGHEGALTATHESATNDQTRNDQAIHDQAIHDQAIHDQAIHDHERLRDWIARLPSDRAAEIFGPLANEVAAEWGTPFALPVGDESRHELERLTRELTFHDSRERTRAERKLRECGAAALPYLRSLALHPFDLTRRAVFDLVRHLEDNAAAEVALIGLTDPDVHVRESAYAAARKFVPGANVKYDPKWEERALHVRARDRFEERLHELRIERVAAAVQDALTTALEDVAYEEKGSMSHAPDSREPRE